MQETLTFSVSTDLHYKKGMYAATLEDMRQIIRRAREQQARFMLHAGDLCNDYKGSPELMRVIRQESGMPFYNVYGNHEMESMGNTMEFVTPLLTTDPAVRFARSTPQCAYYEMDYPPFRFLFLDTCYSWNPKTQEYEHNQEASWSQPEGNERPYSLGNPQKQWLEERLLDAAKRQYRCVIVSHEGFSGLWSSSPDAEEVRALFAHANALRPGTVTLAINGHHHRFFQGSREGVVYLNINCVRNGCWRGNQTDAHYAPGQTSPQAICAQDGTVTGQETIELDSLTQGRNTWFYDAPLSAIITLTTDGRITVQGSRAGWLYNVLPPISNPAEGATIPDSVWENGQIVSNKREAEMASRISFPPFAWRTDAAYPAASPAPRGIRRSILHRADAEYPFLHDTMITAFEGRLLCAWYNCTENEIEGKTVIRGRWSEDGGETWGPPEEIAHAAPGSGVHMVPVVFAQEKGALYAYVTEMVGHDLPVGYAVYRYVKTGWERIARRDLPALLNHQPQQLENGTWISAGRISRTPGTLPLIPCVFHGQGEAPIDWRAQPLPGPWVQGDSSFPYPETTLLVAGQRLTAVTRNDNGPAQAFESADGGQTFSAARDVGLPITDGKLCGGTLSTGQQYLIYNEKNASGSRNRLVIALRRSSDAPFEAVYTLFADEDTERAAGPLWHYPCALEWNGKLFVSCTASQEEDVHRHAALAVIPVASLAF